MVAKISALEQKLSASREDLSERLRALIHKRFPGRGRFFELEKASGITAGRWKNLFYCKQEATSSMIESWITLYPEDVSFIAGRLHSESNYPFNAPMPDPVKMTTVLDRLRWVIAEWAGVHADRLFVFLESHSDRKISAGDWSRVILGLAEPTLEMIEVVCRARPMYTQWVILGRVETNDFN